MVGRFVHYYAGYTIESALKMPWRRFIVMLRKIAELQAEDDLRALEIAVMTANPGKRGEHLRSFIRRLQKQIGSSADTGGKPVVAGEIPSIFHEAQPGSISAEYERVKAEAEELERKRAATKHPR